MYLNAQVFVCCFSEEADLLSQWRGYCPNGLGYSIGFGKSILEKAIEHPQIDIAQCIYDRDKQRRIISALLNETIENHISEYNPEADLNTVFQILWRTFLDQFFRLAALIKHPSFREEKEWRMVYHVRKIKQLLHLDDPEYRRNLRIRYRPAASLLIPYVSMPLLGDDHQRGNVTVVIGPSQEPDLAYASLYSIKHLAEMGVFEELDKESMPVLHIDPIKNSSIPYRTL